MPLSPLLPESFYRRSPVEVAAALLGQRLVRDIHGARLAGYILETEAYDGEQDLACHAKAGLTPRTAVMYGPPGCAYIYFTYGLHWMFNCVTYPEGQPGAVLVRALLPSEGLEQIAARRPGRKPPDWASGPARLCQALGIDGSLNRADLTATVSGVWIESCPPVDPAAVITGPRVGIAYAGEPWVSMPWRFRIHPSALVLP